MSNCPSALNINIDRLTADISQLKESLVEKERLLSELQDAKSRYVYWQRPNCYCQFPIGNYEDYSSDEDEGEERGYDDYEVKEDETPEKDDNRFFWNEHCDDHCGFFRWEKDPEEGDDSITKDRRESHLAKSKSRDAERFARHKRTPRVPRFTRAVDQKCKIRHKRRRRTEMKHTVRNDKVEQ